MDVFSIRRVCRCYGLGGFNVRGVVFAKKERHKVAPRRPRRGAGPPAVGADHRVCYRTGPRGGGGRTHGLPPLTAAASAGHSHVRATPPCYHSALHRFTPFVRLWATVKGPQTASSKSAQTASRIGSRPATAARGPGSLRKARSRPPEVPRIDQGGRGGAAWRSAPAPSESCVAVRREVGLRCAPDRQLARRLQSLRGPRLRGGRLAPAAASLCSKSVGGKRLHGPHRVTLLRHEDDRLPCCYRVHHQGLASGPRRITAGRQCNHRCLGPLATASWAPEEAPATRRYRVFPHESCRYPNCVRQPRHSPATRLPPLRRCRRQMRPQQPACAQLSSTVRRTTSSVPAAANSSQPRTVAGVQRPAVRLDRRDDIPLEPLIEPLGRRLVGHRQHLGSRSWPQGQETCCAKANRTGGCALEDLPRSVTRNRSRRGSSNGR